MRLHVRWRSKGPRRRPSFERRSKGRDPGAMADLPHRPRPRPSSKTEKKNERTNEGPRKQRGAFDFRSRGVSIYFSQLTLVRVDFQSVFATLNLKRTHAHRKICLPKPLLLFLSRVFRAGRLAGQSVLGTLADIFRCDSSRNMVLPCSL